jgi:SAM-dependent methyltransferase
MNSQEGDPSAYGRVWAADYDELYEKRDDPKAVASFIGDLAPGGRVLELGVGTGRLAVPLTEAGLSVTGVDASPEMLARLRDRPGSAAVTVLEGDFATVEAPGPFDLVLIAFSTLFLVPSQAGQIAVLANGFRHLRPGGFLVVEAFVPDHSRWTRGQNLALGRLDAEGVSLKLSVHDPVQQLITTQEVTMDASGLALRPNVLRYAWPAELDAMALAAGLQPAGRWADWSQGPFGAASTSHVSVYQSPEQA